MSTIKKLRQEFGDRLLQISSRSDIPKGVCLVYILLCGDQALVVGEGKENRARVITDSRTSITPGHKKSLKVRLYLLYGDQSKIFSAFVIKCDSKDTAREIEKRIHRTIGGNDNTIDSEVIENLLRGLENSSLAWLLLKQALFSAFDGISDLKKWRREGLIKDDTWAEICKRLEIGY